MSVPPVLPPQFVLGDNNVWPLRLDASEGGGWLLVDAGLDTELGGDPELGGGTELGGVSSWDALTEQARAAGVAPGDVRVVLVTHEHIDHAGLAARWAAQGARIVVGRAGIATLARGHEANERIRDARIEEYRRHGAPTDVLDALRGVHPTRDLRWPPCPGDALVAAEECGSFRLTGGRTLQLIAAPGHTPGNLVALVEETRELFSGDTVIPTTIPTPGLHFPRLLDGDMTRWPSLPPFLASVAAIRALRAHRIYPGHGDVIEDPSVYLDRFEAHHARRAARVRAALAALGETTAFDLTREMFRRLPEPRLGQALTEVLGHLDLLEESGQAERSGEPWRYRLTSAAETSAG